MHINTHYFKGAVSRDYKALSIGQVILSFSDGLLNLFVPIFIYQLFDQNLQYTVLYYGLGSFAYCLGMIWGAKKINVLGFRRSLQFSTLWGALFYGVLYTLANTQSMYLLLIVPIVGTFFTIFYWIPYHIDFTKSTTTQDRAKEVGVLFAAKHLIGAILPFIAAVIITRGGFDMLFFVGIVLVLISGIPYRVLDNAKETFNLNYRDALSKLLSKKNLPISIAFAGDGMESAVLHVIWPIFMLQILDGNILHFGLLSMLILLVALLIDLTLGVILDRSMENKFSILKKATIAHSFGWIVKAFVFTPLHIFIIGIYHMLTMIFLREPADTLYYEYAGAQKEQVTQFVIIHELAIHLGRAVIAIVIALLLMVLPIQIIFVLTAAFPLIWNMLSRYKVPNS